MTLTVTIPTRNRPQKLQRCLAALELARAQIEFLVCVCDSSNDAKMASMVSSICDGFAFVRYYHHSGKNVAAARNFCVRVANTDLIINVDDDIYVEPDAIRLLRDAYYYASGPRVIAGSVAWESEWSTPVVMRSIGYGRKALPGETPSFIIGAFFIYPRAFALTWPWNERIRTSDDRFMGAVWRNKNIQLLYEPRARAYHDEQRIIYTIMEQESHIYANLFDALIAEPSLVNFLSYEGLGFLAGAKQYYYPINTFWSYVQAWKRGHIAFIRDWQHLKRYLESALPNDI